MKRRKDKKNSNSLMLAAAVVISAAVITFALIAVGNTGHMAEYITDIYENDYTVALEAMRLQTALKDVHETMIELVNDPQSQEAKDGMERLAQMRAEKSPPAGMIQQKLNSQLGDDLRQATLDLRAVNDEVIRLMGEGKAGEAKAMLTAQAEPVYERVDNLVGRVIEQGHTSMGYYIDQSQMLNAETSRMMGALAVVVVALTLMAALWSARTVNRRNEEIYRRELMFNTIADNVDDVFVVFDLEQGRLEFVSQNMARIYGIPASDFEKDRSILEKSIAAQDLLRIYEGYQDVGATEVVELEYPVFNIKTNEKKLVATRLYPIMQDGRATKIVGVAHDITRDREAEEALRDALNAAEYANSARRDFLSRVSHEIRTPLNAIVGMQSIARDAVGDDEKTRDCLHKIDISAKLLLGMVNDVLDMSRIESGKLHLKEEEFSLETLVEEVTAVIFVKAAEKEQRFEVVKQNLAGGSLWGDDTRISQVVLNFLTNAVKFTPRGGEVRLTVSQQDWTEDSVFTKFTVTDNGPGIRKAFREKLFIPFEQDETDERIQGTGLGMPISKSLAAMMGGSISVESEEGRGSEFTFGLRLKTTGVPRQAAEEKPAAAFDFSGRNALVAEDNDINMEIMEELLKAVGFHVDKAFDGKQAVERYEQSPDGYYDIAVLDIQMPVMDGAQAARRMRASGRADAAGMVIVATTALTADEDVAGFLSGGINAHFSKPILPRGLYEAIARLLAEKEGKGNELG